jgi:hypothetical protein
VTETATMPAETPTETTTATATSTPEFGTPSLTPSATVDGATFNTIYTENFEIEPLANWSLGEGWTRAQTENGFALQSTQMLQRALFNPLVSDTEITFQVRWDAGRVHLHTHMNGLNEYQFSLSSDFQAILYRNGAIVATALTPEFVSVQWQTITYRKMGSNIEILLNNALILQYVDIEPLLSGQIALSAEGVTRAQWDEMTVKSGEVTTLISPQVPLMVIGEMTAEVTESLSIAEPNVFEASAFSPLSSQATWSHTFDFSEDDGGFRVIDGREGRYVSGVGWRTDLDWDGTNSDRYLHIERLFDTSTITSIEVEYNFQPVNTVGHFMFVGAQTGYPYDTLLTGQPTTGLNTNSLDNVAVTTNVITIFTRVGSVAGVIQDPLGEVTVTKLTLTGLGQNPFEPKWTHTFDFNQSEQGWGLCFPDGFNWNNFDSYSGYYGNGAWNADDSGDGVVLCLTRSMASTFIEAVEIEFSAMLGSDGYNDGYENRVLGFPRQTGGGYEGVVNIADFAGQNRIEEQVINESLSTLSIFARVSIASPNVGTFQLKRVKVVGRGVNPFLDLPIQCEATIVTIPADQDAYIRTAPKNQGGTPIGQAPLGNTFYIMGQHFTDRFWFYGITTEVANNQGDTLQGWIYSGLLDATEVATNCNLSTLPKLNSGGLVPSPTPTFTPGPPTATPTATTTSTPTANPNVTSPLAMDLTLRVESIDSRGDFDINGGDVALGESSFQTIKAYPYRSDFTVTVKLTNISDEPINLADLGSEAYFTFGAPLITDESSVNYRQIDEQAIIFEQPSNETTSRFERSLSYFTSNVIQPNKSVSRTIQFHLTSSQVVKLETVLVGKYQGQDFAVTKRFSVDVPLTYMAIAPGQEFNDIRYTIFWAIYNETSEGRWASYRPSINGAMVPCQDASINEYSPKIQWVEHCESVEYMYARTALNGMLNYERSIYTGQNSTRFFRYFTTNYGSSLGNKDYPLWNNEELYPRGFDIGLNISTKQSYLDSYDNSSLQNGIENWSYMMKWFKFYVINFQSIWCSSTGIYANSSFCSHWQTFYNGTMNEIDRAILDFLSTSQPDTTNYAFSVLGFNKTGRSIVLPITCGSEVFNDCLAQYNTTYPTYFNLMTSYIPSYSSVLRPVVWSQYNRQNKGERVYAGRVWVAGSFQQGQDQRHFDLNLRPSLQP